jgi:hypothetical protein
LLGFEASCEAEPAFGLDDEVEEEVDECESWALPPAAPERPAEPCRPFRAEVWPALSRTTDEKGAPSL